MFTLLLAVQEVGSKYLTDITLPIERATQRRSLWAGQANRLLSEVRVSGIDVQDDWDWDETWIRFWADDWFVMMSTALPIAFVSIGCPIEGFLAKELEVVIMDRDLDRFSFCATPESLHNAFGAVFPNEIFDPNCFSPSNLYFCTVID